MADRKLLCELKIIAQIQQHERLNTRGEHINIDRGEGTVLPQGLRRYIRGESREHNIQKVTDIFHDAVAQIITHMNADDANARPFLQLLHHDLSAAIVGVEHMKVTYQYDSVATASLDVVLDSCRAHVQALGNYLASST